MKLARFPVHCPEKYMEVVWINPAHVERVQPTHRLVTTIGLASGESVSVALSAHDVRNMLIEESLRVYGKAADSEEG